MLYAVLLIGVLLLIMTVTSAINLALREASFAKLARLLSRKGREHWVETYRTSEEKFLLTSAIARMVSLLVLVLVLAHFLRLRQTEQLFLYYAEVFVISGVLVSIFGVAIPQGLAKYAGERLLAMAVFLKLLQATAWLTWPLIWFLQISEEIVRRLVGAPKTNGPDDTEQEVLDAVDEAEMQGAVDKEERAMIQSVMELDQATVDHIMTPRTELVAVPKDITLEDLKALIKEEGHSRIPVYEENIDQVLGLVYAKDLLQVAGDGPFEVSEHLRQVPFVPETKLLRDLLQEFKTGRTHAAVVLDEYGGTAGLVTIEDILEELVGEITDEYEPPEPEPIVQISDQVLELDSRVHVDELNDRLKLEIPEDDDYETIGGFVFSTLGRIPPAGEELVHDNIKITILEAEDRRINRLRLEVLPQQVEQ